MTHHLPHFTVVVPTYDRPRQLAECLAALADLDYPRERFEVVVADDGTPASPERVVAGFRDRLDLRLLTLPHGGPARARNAGAEVARGEYLAFTDDDCAPAVNWLRCLAARFAESPGHAIGGRTINRLDRNPYSTASQVLIDYLYGYFTPRRGRFFTSNNLAAPTSLFQAVGGFDVSFPLPAAEDRESASGGRTSAIPCSTRRRPWSTMPTRWTSVGSGGSTSITAAGPATSAAWSPVSNETPCGSSR